MKPLSPDDRLKIAFAHFLRGEEVPWLARILDASEHEITVAIQAVRYAIEDPHEVIIRMAAYQERAG
jgi:hypothetical protein